MGNKLSSAATKGKRRRKLSSALFAALDGDIARVRALIESGADVNAWNSNGWTALMYASRYGDAATVCALIEAGADVDARNWRGWTALLYASEYGDVATVRALIEAGADVNADSHNDGATALMVASRYGDVARVRALIEAGADVNVRRNYRATALMYASGYGDVARVRALIEAGADVNARNGNGWTALMYASQYGDAEQVLALIEAGVDMNAGSDNDGETALMLASGYGDVARVCALIEGGAQVNARNDNGWTALMYASRYGDVARVRALIEAGADVNARKNRGSTALMYASRYGDVARVRALIEAGADVNARNSNGWTALMYASRYGDVEQVRAFIEAGADVSAPDRDGQTALIVASRYGDLAKVRALIEAGADVNYHDTQGRSALSIARGRGNTKIVTYLEIRARQRRFAAFESGGHGNAETFRDRQDEEPAAFAPDIDSNVHAAPASVSHQQHVEQPDMDSNHITLGKELGQGSYATVYRGTWHGVEIAVKQIRPPPGISWSSADQTLFHRVFEEQVQPEVDIMSAVRHPFVVGCYGCCVDPPSILLELCPRGSLGQMLQKCRQDTALCQLMSWRQRLCMLRQVASAMRFLHSKNVLHRDLRAMNVVVAQDMTAKVSDVGLGKFADEVSSRSAGTLGDGANPRWLAPELVSENEPFTRACDVYGFGTIIWEMMEWRLPWEGLTNVHIIRAMVQGRTLEVAGQETWESLPGPAPQHTGTLSEVCSLAKQCLNVTSSARPSFEDIVQILLRLEEQEPQGELAPPVKSQDPSQGNCSRDALNRLPVCCVCLDTNSNTIMSGCGHLCLCQNCLSTGQVSNCPICRAPGIPQRIYLV